MIEVTLNGKRVNVAEPMSVAALLLTKGITRQSVSGEERAPVCGMGSCFECVATINGNENTRACLVTIVDGMRIEYR